MDGGRQRLRRGGFTRRADAELEFGRVLRLPSPEAVERTWTVRRWLEQWLCDLMAFVRPPTLRAYRSVVHYHLIPHLGMYRLSKLRTKTVQRMIDAIARTRVRGGRPISPGTVNRIAAVLRSALSEARRRAWSATTPHGGYVYRQPSAA